MESNGEGNYEWGVSQEVAKHSPHHLTRKVYMDFSFERTDLGGHVGVDADGGEHGEVDEEVPAGKEHQGSRKSSKGEGQDDMLMA